MYYAVVGTGCTVCHTSTVQLYQVEYEYSCRTYDYSLDSRRGEMGGPWGIWERGYGRGDMAAERATTDCEAMQREY